MKKVLILSPFYPPFPKPGATKRTENFVRYLPESGWEPVVLTMNWGSRDRTEKLYVTRNLARASWRAYHLADVEEERSWTSVFVNYCISCLRTLKTYILIPDELILWLWWVLPKARRIFHAEGAQLIYTTAPPNSSLLTAIVLKKIFGVPVVCDIRDDWADNPIMEKQSRLLKYIERRLEAWVTRSSDKIILVTATSRDQWVNRYPNLKDKFCLIPNGYSEDEYSAAAEHRFEEFALVHVGSLESNRSPELIYQALSKIDAKGKKIGFYQYGLTLRAYRESAAGYGIEDIVHFEGTITSDQALSRIKGASLLVLLPTRNAPTAIPGKAYEYLRTGKPILMVSEENTTTEFMRRFPGVYHVLPDEPDKCRDIIKRVYDEQAAGTSAAGCAEILKYDRRSLTKSLAHEFDTLVAGRAGRNRR